ncbi:McrC family protein [Tessaracoccus palaemonis]|uniref:McrC family protein n=1 Tax=Tessaracoccus palaemonis TaxID=2829499 RepID=A0ABX8SHL6_9ACTN|nr:McrC family protein [Tessaracoccus palaemonis]QXT62886.1 McrC family protein [Tessaracoccus palaemonis]
MTTRPPILREGEPPHLVHLRGGTADALLESGVLKMTRTDRSGWWEVAAGTQVGVVSVAGIEVIIRPKIDINRLVFLMGYARRPSHWRDDLVHLDPDAELTEALADAFLALTRRAVDQGLLKGYVTVDDSLPVLRGRIREADQLRRRFGREVPLEVRYDDFTVDIPENQLLLAAVERLLALPGVTRRHRGGLQRLRLQLADVSRLPRGVRPAWTPSRLNARYVPALELAELILAGRSFEQRVGDTVVTGYLLNMARVFEDFVTVALREAFRAFGGRSQLQYGAFLDEAETVPVKPDFVWLEQGVPRVVVDAKYKAEKPSGFPQADLYQLLAYCTVLGLDEGHLVYAKGSEDERTHVVKRAGVRIIAHTLDLDVPRSDLLEQVAGLARVIHSSETEVPLPSLTRDMSNKPTTNSSVRARLGISDRNKAQSSRITREAADDGMVVTYDPTVGPGSIRHVPFWADPER